MNFYDKYIKRFFDILIGLVALVGFGWVYIIIAIVVKKNMGSPVLYTAERIGKDGRIFNLYKFRSMTNDVDADGNLLPDVDRLTKFGRLLRATSLDEIPEAINILKGDMSLIGPRPLPTIYFPYYTDEEFHRHDVRPGLSGLAQANGRNSLSWEEKFKYDLEYVENISLFLDIEIIVKTVVKVLNRADIGQGEEMPESLHRERAGQKYR